MPRMKPKATKKAKSRLRAFELTPLDESHFRAIQQKYPELNYTAIFRRALRELAQKEQVA